MSKFMITSIYRRNNRSQRRNRTWKMLILFNLRNVLCKVCSRFVVGSFLCKLNKKSIFSEREYSDLYPKCSKIGNLYGTKKLHKSFSSGFIPPLTVFYTKDSFTFIEEIFPWKKPLILQLIPFLKITPTLNSLVV